MKMKGKRFALAMLAAGLCSIGLAAQASSDEQQTAPNRTDIVPQTPTFRVRIDLVTTDVIARDNKGQFVSDLKPGDFEVYEDGVKQDITTMTLFHGGRQFSPLTAPPPPPEEGIILPPPRPTNDAAGRIFIFFVDDLHLDFRNTGRIRELFTKIRKTLVHDGDMFGIVSTGPSSLAIDMTYDIKRLDEAIKKIAGNGLKPNDIITGGETSEGPNEVRYRAHVAFSTAYDLMKNLEGVHNRRKALIYVSNGYDFNPFSDARKKNYMDQQPTPQGQDASAQQQAEQEVDWQRQGQQFADADLARELADLTRTANRANVTMYTIDPRGLVGGPDIDEQVDPTEWQDYIRKSQDSLRVLADETGGIAVVNQNDFDRALKRIDAETSDYYVLGYYSSNPDPTKKRRTLEVKVPTRKDITVWSRKGYQLKPVPKPTVK
ncbi:MAG TPA: VWA domain-containing protein [Vicinamibacterales bacterium]|jgi:VWFA-related protein